MSANWLGISFIAVQLRDVDVEDGCFCNPEGNV